MSFVINKVTQYYDANQDRVRLVAENLAGEVKVIWLTQRLANRLVKMLSEWLDEEVKAAAVHHAPAAPVTNLQFFEQMAAQVQLKPDQPPVVVESAVPEVLPNRVDLFRNKKAQLYTLEFKFNEVELAKLQLSSTQLRQWLGILYQMFGLGEWSKHVWPQWFNPALNNNAPQDNRALH